MAEEEDFADTLAYYESQHTTAGCKWTHMFGVPMIALSVPMLLVSPRRAANLFAGGWALQFIGHYVFEKNSPVILSDHRSPKVIAAAVYFVTDGWMRVLTGRPLIDNPQPKLLTLDPDGNRKYN
jgi:uncharacterized membrane protein YGL010W